MEKIEFVNNQPPYISAENLNQLQDNVENAINETNTYLTEEVKTGAKWVDGKPIYRKCYAINFTSSYEENGWYYYWFNSGISNVETLVDSNLSVNMSDRKFTSNSNKLCEVVYLTTGGLANQIQVGLSNAYGVSAFNGSVVLEYTKTTD